MYYSALITLVVMQSKFCMAIFKYHIILVTSPFPQISLNTLKLENLVWLVCLFVQFDLIWVVLNKGLYMSNKIDKLYNSK